jgi:hypothetical protein
VADALATELPLYIAKFANYFEIFPSTLFERPIRPLVTFPKVQDRLAACVMEN